MISSVINGPKEPPNSNPNRNPVLRINETVAKSWARLFSPTSVTDGCGLVRNFQKRPNPLAEFLVVIGASFNVMAYSAVVPSPEAPFDFCGLGEGGVDGFTS